MKRILFGLALVALGTGSEAIAGTCNVQSTRAPGHWKFIKVYDVDTGKIVLQKVFNGGEYQEVTVPGERIRVDWKLPGGKDYKHGTAALCKDGNTIRS